MKTGIGKISVTNLKNGTFFGRVGAITKNKIDKKYFYFFFNFRKFGSVGSVKRKIKKLWPYRCICMPLILSISAINRFSHL